MLGFCLSEYCDFIQQGIRPAILVWRITCVEIYLHDRTCMRIEAPNINLIPLLVYSSTCTKPEKWLVIYMFAGKLICSFSIGFWNFLWGICLFVFSFYWYIFSCTFFLYFKIVINIKLKTEMFKYNPFLWLTISISFFQQISSFISLKCGTNISLLVIIHK